MPAYLVMPLWQGSPSARAMQLIVGAEALREDLPASATREVPVPLEAGDALGTPVARLSSVIRARDAAAEVVAEFAKWSPESVILVGGDCSSSLAGVSAALARGGRVAVLWFDAHPDLQDPSTSPSGGAAGMTLLHALGGGVEDLALAPPVDAELVTLVGARMSDAEEETAIAERGLAVAHWPGGQVGQDPEAFAESLRARLRELDADTVYVHVDLDVLDPAEFASVHAAAPFGLSATALTAAVRAAVSELPLAGAAICGFAPKDEVAAADDRPTVLRILAALTSGTASGRTRELRADGGAE